MNKRVILLVVTLLVPAILSTSVMADPTKGQKVPAKLTITGLIGFSPPTREWVTNGDIMQFRQLYQPHSFILTVGGQVSTGFTSGFEDGKWNMKTKTAIVHAKATYWINGKNGGFEGNVHFGALNFNLYTGTWDWEIIHILAQGFGDFEGQTLMVSYEGPQGGVRTGYCLKS